MMNNKNMKKLAAALPGATPQKEAISMMNQTAPRVYIAKIVCENAPKIRVDSYEVLANQKGSLVIQRANDVRRFQQNRLGKYKMATERYREEGYGKTPEEAVAALRKGLKDRSATLIRLARALHAESELPYGAAYELVFKNPAKKRTV